MNKGTKRTSIQTIQKLFFISFFPRLAQLHVIFVLITRLVFRLWLADSAVQSERVFHSKVVNPQQQHFGLASSSFYFYPQREINAIQRKITRISSSLNSSTVHSVCWFVFIPLGVTRRRPLWWALTASCCVVTVGAFSLVTLHKNVPNGVKIPDFFFCCKPDSVSVFSFFLLVY